MPQWTTGQCERKDKSQENTLKCPATGQDVVSLLEQINKAFGTRYVTTGSANMFLSAPIRKETQKCPDVHGVDIIFIYDFASRVWHLSCPLP